MTFRVDLDEFEKRQSRLLEEIARDVKEAFQAAGVSGEALETAVYKLTFSIAAIVDSSREMELDGKPLRPVLTFADDGARQELVAAEVGSYMHEFASEIVYNVFNAPPA